MLTKARISVLFDFHPQVQKSTELGSFWQEKNFLVGLIFFHAVNLNSWTVRDTTGLS